MLARPQLEFTDKSLSQENVWRKPDRSPLCMPSHAPGHQYPWLSAAIPSKDAAAFIIPLPGVLLGSRSQDLAPRKASTKNARPSKALTLVRKGQFLYGAVQMNGSDIELATTHAYTVILDALREMPECRLLRVWHYLPDINSENNGIERYQAFSRARYDAMAAYGYQMADDLPAASAIGTKSDHLVVHFIAAQGLATSIENPRQMSAYRYPRQYGPRSPSFSRAILHNGKNQQQLFISGTASIIGHTTVAPLEPERQTLITLENLSLLLDSAGFPALSKLGSNADWCVYVRARHLVAAIDPILRERFGKDSRISYLEGDICRQDLLVEIEGLIHRPIAP